ncbi:MAG: hypothetical protein KIT83_15330 [Bryobacterales bacterium]|nr:hypothetical protein [Bryobacterales bacterium]
MTVTIFRTQISLAALCLMVVACTTFAGAQPRLLEAGFKVGAPLNDLVNAEQDRTIPLTTGLMAVVNLPLGFAVEGNALYKRLGFKIDSSSLVGGRPVDSRFNSWEFPILLRSYPLGRNPLFQPFLSAGLNIRATSGEVLGLGRNRQTSSGLVLAAGVRNGPGRVKLAPEIRFTRWADRPPVLTGPGGTGARLNANQLEVLLGLTF